MNYLKSDLSLNFNSRFIHSEVHIGVNIVQTLCGASLLKESSVQVTHKHTFFVSNNDCPLPLYSTLFQIRTGMKGITLDVDSSLVYYKTNSGAREHSVIVNFFHLPLSCCLILSACP